MRTQFIFLLVIHLCVFCAPPCGHCAEPSITLRGRVVKAGSNNNNPYPVEEASVSLLTTADQLVGSGFTNGDGIFFIPNVVPGDYVLRVDFDGKLLQKFKITIPFDIGRFQNGFFDLPTLNLVGTFR